MKNKYFFKFYKFSLKKTFIESFHFNNIPPTLLPKHSNLYFLHKKLIYNKQNLDYPIKILKYEGEILYGE